jgi:hypothetical protein
MFEGRVLARGDVQVGGGITPAIMNAGSDEIGARPLELVDLADTPLTRIIPTSSAGFVDTTGRYHIYVAGQTETGVAAFDVMPFDDLAVEILSSPNAINDIQANRFPKASGSQAGLARGFGDGKTDGAGIIASIHDDAGRLLVSNSQSGGFSYPDRRILSHEMPRVLRFKATECYTRGNAPNTVSMDYVFIEADDDGGPVDSSVWLETWDMPLPEPILTATMDGDRIILRIDKDAWFIPGGTTVAFSDPTVQPSSIQQISERELAVTATGPLEPGTSVTFEARSELFYHRGVAPVT